MLNLCLKIQMNNFDLAERRNKHASTQFSVAWILYGI